MPRYNTPIVLTPQDEARFWAKVDRSPGQGPHGQCWEWRGGRLPAGYGKFWLGGGERVAHRVAWVIANGPIPAGLDICHKCDHPPCCNPECLFAGTNIENVADRQAKGRQARGDRQGLRLHPERAPRGDRNTARRHPERRPRGDRHGCAKLTTADVIAIREEWAALGTDQSIIGERYGISQATVSSIVRRKTWKHID